MSTTIFATLQHVTCCNQDCGILFGIESGRMGDLRQSHNWFYCPNGHRQHFTGQTDAEREREARQEVERQLSYVRSQRDGALNREATVNRQLRATRGVITRIKRRVAHGVCPCCKRTFANVARHMTGQHPDYVEASS